MNEPKHDAATLTAFLPADKRAVIARLKETTPLSEAALVAMTLAGEALRDWCPSSERALAAGILMRIFAEEGKHA